MVVTIKFRFENQLCVENVLTPYDICLIKQLPLVNFAKKIFLTLLNLFSPNRLTQKKSYLQTKGKLFYLFINVLNKI